MKIKTFLIIILIFLSMWIIYPETINAPSLHNRKFIDSPIGEIIDDTYPYNFTDPSGHIYAIEFSRKNEYLAIGVKSDTQNFVHILNVGTWTTATTLGDATDDIYDVAWSPNDTYFAYCGKDTKVYIYWTSNWTKKMEITEASNTVRSVDFSVKHLMAFGGLDKGLWIYNVTNNFSNETFEYIGYNIYTVKFTKQSGGAWGESGWVIAGTSNNSIFMWYTFAGSWNLDAEIIFASSSVLSIDVSDDDNYIACGSSGYFYILQYNAFYGEYSVYQNISATIDSLVYGIAFSNDSYNWLAVTTWNADIVLIYNTTSWEQVGYFEYYYSRSVDFDQNNTYIAYGGVESLPDYTGDVCIRSIFDVERISGYGTERIEISDIVNGTHNGDVTLKIPVTSDVYQVLNLTNNTDGSDGTEKDNYESLTDIGDFFLNITSDYIYIMPGNLTIGDHIYWTINLSYGLNFNLIIPPYLNVGEYYHSSGRISYNNRTSCNGFYAITRVLNSTKNSMLTVNPEWDCHNGNYLCSFSTHSLPPDTYEISINFTDSITNITIKQNETLYLSVDPGPGIYVPSELYFNFYDNDTGEGLIKELFKIYVSEDTTIETNERMLRDTYLTYTGDTIYYRIDDYFDNQIYPLSGSYQTLNIISIRQSEDIPIDWNGFSVKNMNHSIVWFNMTNESRSYSQYIFPYEPFYWNVLSGEYTINLTYKNPVTDVIEGYNEENITINSDAYYWIQGYDIRDVIIEIQLTNTSLNSLIIDVTANVNLTDSSIDTIVANISTNLYGFENNITNLIYNVWSNLNLTDVNISNMHIAIANNINLAENNITSIQLNIWSAINNTWINKSIVMFSFFNTNDGLGLPWDILKVYVNGVRLTDQIFWCDNGTVINVTINDYYNFTMYNNIFTINASSVFLDLGLTFHSWLFGNHNEDYYIISFLKENASRWFERGIITEREFLLPSGNYTMRIYDRDYYELHNSSWVMDRSRVFVIFGINLSLIIDGLSIVIGHLLDFRSEFNYYTTPDIIRISDNKPMIFSVYEPEGMLLDEFATLICPALIVKARTFNETYSNSLNSIAKIPGNDTVENGTISILKDTLHFSGSANWVNISYTDNGTLMQNTSHIPIEVMLSGENVTINASSNITIRRETRYQQVTKFEWLYHQNEGWGPIPIRAGWHEAGIEVKNPMNVPIYDVYIFVQFSDETSCDQDTVQVQDIDNDGSIIEGGLDYDVTNEVVQFYLSSITANTIQYYKISYYKSLTESYYYGEDQKSIYGYKNTVWDGKSYHYFDVNYHNPRDKIFRGGLYIKLDFDKPKDLDDENVRIIDLDDNVEIASKNFVVGINFIRIDNEALGDVQPGGGRNFRVYFIFKEYPGSGSKDFHLNTIIWEPLGIPVTTFLIILLIGIFITVGGAIYTLKSTSDDKKKRGITIALLGIFIIFIFYVLATIGV